MPEYKLYYFDTRGVGEPIRYMFVLKKVPFEDIRISKKDWNAEWKPKMLYKSLPILEVDGKQLAQSMTIMRYLARELGLLGKNNWEIALADMYVCGLQDILPRGVFQVSNGVFDGDKAESKKQWGIFKESTLNPFLDRYQAFLQKNGTGYFVGDSLTWADVVIAEKLEKYHVCFDDTCLDNHIPLKKFVERIHQQGHLEEYYAGRKSYNI